MYMYVYVMLMKTSIKHMKVSDCYGSCVVLFLHCLYSASLVSCMHIIALQKIGIVNLQSKNIVMILTCGCYQQYNIGIAIVFVLVYNISWNKLAS